jgi:hypothetical protein
MPPDEVSHRDIYVRLAELGGDVKSLLSMVGERKEDVVRLSKDLDALFTRQRTLETETAALSRRMAQVIIVGAIVAIMIPVVGSAMHIKLQIPAVTTEEPSGSR